MSAQQLTHPALVPAELIIEEFEEHPSCPKCKHKDIKLNYARYTTAQEDGGGTELVEYIKCCCERCGYRWTMDTADAEFEDEPSTQGA
jgi:C4-type Zn-finger protein